MIWDVDFKVLFRSNVVGVVYFSIRMGILIGVGVVETIFAVEV